MTFPFYGLAFINTPKMRPALDKLDGFSYARTGHNANRARKFISLRKKGFILILLHALMQSILIILLIVLHNNTQFYILCCEQERKYAMALGKYVLDDAAVLHCVKESIDKEIPLDARCEKHLRDLMADRRQLIVMCREFPKCHEIISVLRNDQEIEEKGKDLAEQSDRLAQVANATIRAIEAVRQSNVAVPSKSFHSREKKLALDEARRVCRDARGCLSSLTEYKAKHETSRTRGEQQRLYLAFVLLWSAANLSWLLAGRFFARDISLRMSAIQDNSTRFKNGQALNPLVGGSDEIANLDQAFHHMANTLTNASHAHKAMIENASALIFSTDEHARFVAVSRTALAMTGYHPDELIGTWLIDIVEPSEQHSVAKKMIDIAGGGKEIAFETRLVLKNGSRIDALWSACWSPVDRSTFSVIHDITEQKTAERLQLELTEMVSHDLKSPLAAVSLFYELLEEGMLGRLKEEGSRQVKIAQSNVQQITTLIESVLEIERINTGVIKLNQIQLSLAGILERSVQSVRASAGCKGITIHVEPTDLIVRFDERRIIQILVNLLSHVIGISPWQSTITIAASKQHGVINIAIKIERPRLMETVVDDSPLQPMKSYRMLPGSPAGAEAKSTNDKAKGSKVSTGPNPKLIACQALAALYGGGICVEGEIGLCLRIPTDGASTTLDFSVPTISTTAILNLSEGTQDTYASLSNRQDLDCLLHEVPIEPGT